MRVLLLLFPMLGVSFTSRLLTSEDLGNIIIKYANDEIGETELHAIKEIFMMFRPVWDNPPEASKAVNCFVCRAGFYALTFLISTGVSDEKIIKTATFLCTLSISTHEVCQGMLDLNYEILKYIIYTTPEAKSNTFCGLILQTGLDKNYCSFEDPRFEWQVNLPDKIDRDIIYQNPEDFTNLTIALFSDIHLDLLYEPNGVADCDEPTFCDQGQKPKSHYYEPIIDDVINKYVINKNGDIMVDLDGLTKIGEEAIKSPIPPRKESPPAGYWGDYRNCDTPLWAYDDVLKSIASHKNVDIVYYVGDNIDHHIWKTTYDLNNKVHTIIVKKMREAFGSKVTVIPTVGNHESQPANQFAPDSVQDMGLNTTWLYASLAKKWETYLGINTTYSMLHQGQFSILIRPGLRVISLNTQVAYKYNWWVVYDPVNAKRQLQWLVDELYKAEQAGERVHILSHIPPGHEDLMYTWTREYQRIVERFSSTVSSQFTAHTHTDEWKVFYRKDTGEAFSVAWGAGSATTYAKVNLNYKIITVNKNYEPINIENYIYNLTEANLTPDESPKWFKLYDMKTTYQLDDLSPDSMDQLIQGMATTKKFLLDIYVAYISKMSDVRPYCDHKCKMEALCRAVTTVLWKRDKCNGFNQLIEATTRNS